MKQVYGYVGTLRILSSRPLTEKDMDAIKDNILEHFWHEQRSGIDGFNVLRAASLGLAPDEDTTAYVELHPYDPQDDTAP